MEKETIYFAEEVRGHKFLMTSNIILFKGKQLLTPKVDELSVLEFAQSINAIPAVASYRVSFSEKGKSVIIDCAKAGGIFWLGKSQFQRIKKAAMSAVGGRLFSQALKVLISGETLYFQSGAHSPEILFTLTRQGIGIDQRKALFSDKKFSIRWEHLRVSTSSGTMYLQCYASGNKINIPVWRMRNNVVFTNLIGFLIDKANYRVLHNAE